jgi:hypothetical protein
MSQVTHAIPSIRLLPKGETIGGRVVDFVESDGGIALVEGEVRNVTIFLLVDSIGPQVERCKQGDVIAFHHASHVWTRAGHHFLIVQDKDVYAVVEGLEESIERALRGEGPLSVEGVPRVSAKHAAE